MVHLSFHEARVLGTLVEKATTTPAQYPLSLNALTVGSNQKNNRDPVTALTDDQVFDAVDSLRRKLLVAEVHLSDSRVAKFKHTALAPLGVTLAELALLADLMLRGPQSVAELRANANRMTPIADADACKALLEGLAARPDPLVERLPRRAGERTERWRETITVDRPAPTPPLPADHEPEAPPATPLEERVARLESEVAGLRAMIESLTGGQR